MFQPNIYEAPYLVAFWFDDGLGICVERWYVMFVPSDLDYPSRYDTSNRISSHKRDQQKHKAQREAVLAQAKEKLTYDTGRGGNPKGTYVAQIALDAFGCLIDSDKVSQMVVKAVMEEHQKKAAQACGG